MLCYTFTIFTMLATDITVILARNLTLYIDINNLGLHCERIIGVKMVETPLFSHVLREI